MSCYNTIPRSLRLRLQESLIDAISNTLLEEFNNLKIVDNIFNISDDLFNKVKNILYLMSPTEIQARINQQYRLICDLTNEEINEIIKNNDIIGSLIQYFKNINLYDKYLLDFNILLKNDIVSNNYEYVLLLNIIGYYGHMQKLLKNDIKESSIRKMLQNNKYTSLDKQNADKVKYDINKFISNYFLSHSISFPYCEANSLLYKKKDCLIPNLVRQSTPHRNTES